ncbi:hypothetical protein GCM10027346_28920 [Hymenobacter seoulensis]
MLALVDVKPVGRNPNQVEKEDKQVKRSKVITHGTGKKCMKGEREDKASPVELRYDFKDDPISFSA